MDAFGEMEELQVGVQGLGCMRLASVDGGGQDNASAVFREALAGGVVLFHCGSPDAEDYGATLRLLQKCIEGVDRAAYKLMVKLGVPPAPDVAASCDTSEAKGTADRTEEGLKKDLDFVLQTLRVDFVDIILLSCAPPWDVDIVDAMIAMTHFVQDGHARYVGVSEADAGVGRFVDVHWPAHMRVHAGGGLACVMLCDPCPVLRYVGPRDPRSVMLAPASPPHAAPEPPPPHPHAAPPRGSRSRGSAGCATVFLTAPFRWAVCACACACVRVRVYVYCLCRRAPVLLVFMDICLCHIPSRLMHCRFGAVDQYHWLQHATKGAQDVTMELLPDAEVWRVVCIGIGVCTGTLGISDYCALVLQPCVLRTF